MAKKITDEQGNTYVQKKPFYKKWWFILLAALIIIGVISGSLGGGKKSSDGAKKVDSSETKKEEKKEEKTTFKVGETVSLNNVEFKVNKVEFNPGTQYSKPKDGNEYVIVNVTITNKGDKKINYNPFDFKLDSNGNQTSLTEMVTNDDGSQLVNDNLSSGTLTKDGSVTGSMIGQAKKGDKDKLLYTGNMFSEKEKITFELN